MEVRKYIGDDLIHKTRICIMNEGYEQQLILNCVYEVKADPGTYKIRILHSRTWYPSACFKYPSQLPDKTFNVGQEVHLALPIKTPDQSYPVYSKWIISGYCEVNRGLVYWQCKGEYGEALILGYLLYTQEECDAILYQKLMNKLVTEIEKS